MLKVIQYFKGYLFIQIKGSAANRFLNLCVFHDIFLWNIQKNKEGYCMNISLKGFYQIKDIARKTGTKVVILKRIGLPFFIPFFRMRVVFLFGIAAFLVVIIFASTIMWKIEIKGMQKLSEENIKEVLKSNNVEEGMKKTKINEEEIEKLLRKQFDQITWITVYQNGTKLIIELKENPYGENVVKKENNTESADIYSTESGTIVKLAVRNGTPMTAVNNIIEKNQLLISSDITPTNEYGEKTEPMYCKAEGEIVIESQKRFQIKVENKKEIQNFTGEEKKKLFLEWKDLKKEFPQKEPEWNNYTSEKMILLNQGILKLGYFNLKEYHVKYTKYNQEELENLIEKKIQELYQTLEEKGVQIMKKNVRIEQDGDIYTISLNLVLRGAFYELRERNELIIE